MGPSPASHTTEQSLTRRHLQTHVIYFVWWIGIGNAGMLISSLLLLTHQKRRAAINRFAEAMTIMAVAIAGIFPIIHLGQPMYFLDLRAADSLRHILAIADFVWIAILLLLTFADYSTRPSIARQANINWQASAEHLESLRIPTEPEK